MALAVWASIRGEYKRSGVFTPLVCTYNMFFLLNFHTSLLILISLSGNENGPAYLQSLIVCVPFALPIWEYPGLMPGHQLALQALLQPEWN
jgi:hypothetical protein